MKTSVYVKNWQSEVIVEKYLEESLDRFLSGNLKFKDISFYLPPDWSTDQIRHAEKFSRTYGWELQIRTHYLPTEEIFQGTSREMIFLIPLDFVNSESKLIQETAALARMAETIEIPAGVRCRVDSDEPPYQDIDKDLTYPPESPT